MIYREEAERQVLRLSVLPGMEQLDVNSDELTDALQRGTRDLEHAGCVVTELLKRWNSAPSPAEIIELARRMDHELDPRAWRCSKCGATGWRRVFELHTWCGEGKKAVQALTRSQFEDLQKRVSGFVGEQVVVEAVTYCPCPIGRKLREAADIERAKELEKERQKQEKSVKQIGAGR